MRIIGTIRGICLGVFLLFALLTPRNVSGSQIHLSFAEIAQTADLTFVGTAVQESCWVNQQQTMIFTDVLLEDISVVHAKGSSVQKGSNTIRLTFAGGTLDGRSCRISDTPELQMGHRYLIFALDDGKTYLSPIVGGTQGLFEVVEDAGRGEFHVLTFGRKAVLGFEAEGPRLSTDRVLEIRGGVMVAAPKPEEVLVGPPSSHDPNSSARASRLETAQGSPVTLKEFTRYVKSEALIIPLKNRMLRLDGQGLFYKKGDGQGAEVENLKLTHPSRVPRLGEFDPKNPPPHLHVPEADGSSEPSQGRGGERSTSFKGGPLGACGFQDLPIVMEQVPESNQSWEDNDNAMWIWNQFMDVYEYTGSDGDLGYPNLESEFCGWIDDATLYYIWGAHWGPTTVGICFPYGYTCECCEIWEADVALNPAFDWTHDPDFSIGNPNVVLVLPVIIHEVGHTWGYMCGTWDETYDYDRPSVMHPYYDDIVEDGLGIHRTDAHIFRNHYADQTAVILSTLDMGVESYWADNGLHNSYTDAPSYCPGDDITLNNVTVENNTFLPLFDVRIRFYLSYDNNISTSDYQMGTDWSWTSFAGETYDVTDYTTSVPPEVPPGEYYVGAIVTHNGYESDSYPNNNATYFYDKISVLPPVCQMDPASLHFGTVCVGEYEDMTFTITNIGACTLTGTVEEFYPHYSIRSGGGSYSLGPGQSRTVTVRFQPTSAGTKDGFIETAAGCAQVYCTGVGSAQMIAVTSPDGGESWCEGNSYQITWTSSCMTGPVKIEYSTNHGVNWTTITSSTTDDGSYSWHVPEMPSMGCRVKVTSNTNPSIYDESNANFTIRSKQVMVDSPNGGEDWCVARSEDITWDSWCINGPVKLEYSTSGGLSWMIIDSSTTDDGIYAWTVPNTPTTLGKVKVTSTWYPSIYDRSNANFTIQTPSMAVTRPNGGETWSVGNSERILWTSSCLGHGHSVKIDYSTNGGSSWLPVALSTPDDGLFMWTVPNTPSTTCRVKVTEIGGGSIYDMTDSDFTITAEAVTVSSPDGGEGWCIDSAYAVSWSSSWINDVRIEYTSDGCSSWSTIADDVPADSGIYNWIVPPTPSQSCKVRICDAGDGAPCDESNRAFTIWDGPHSFLYGDANGDGIINVGDVVYLVSYLYKNGPAPDPEEAGDANCNDIINVGDIVYLVSYLYRGGDPPGCP